MVEIASLEIGASINTENIDSGLTRIKQGFDNLEAKTGGINADFERMSKSSKSLSKNFMIMAVAGAGALVALTKNSPALASAMAKIKVSTGELARSLGTALQPAFNWFADKLQGVTEFVDAHPDLVGGITTSVVALSGAFLAFKIGSAFLGLSAIIMSPAFLIGVAALASLALVFDVFKSHTDVQDFVKEELAAGKTEEEIIRSPGYVGRLPALAGPGAAFGAASQGGVLGNIADWLSEIFKSKTRKSTGMSLPDQA